MESFLKYLTYEKRSSVHTLRAYETDLSQFSQHLAAIEAGVDLAGATHSMIRSWVIDLAQRQISERSINRKIASLRAYYKFLVKRSDRKDNPAAKMVPLKTPKELPQFIKEEEMLQLFDTITYEDDLLGRRDRLILELLYGTGMRLSELINLKEGDINLFQGTLRVFGKRSKERVIPIHQSLVNIIREYLNLKHMEWGRIDWLLLTDKGEKAYPMMIYRIVKKYLDQITTLSKKSPHVIRHTFATHLLNKGAELNAVKDLLGHSSLAATQVYTHNTMEKLKSTFDQAHPKA